MIAGGGMTTPDDVMDAWAAGADLAVVGTAIEHDPQFLQRLRLPRPSAKADSGLRSEL